MKALLASIVAVIAILVAGPAWADIETTGISPSTGPASGGTLVTITGTDLDTVTSIRFEGKSYTPASQSANQLTFVTQATSGVVGPCGDVSLSGGGSDDDSQTFCFYASITSVSPSAGPVGGGTTVTVTGTGLYATTGAKFGGVSGANYDANNDTTFTIHTPAGTGPGPVDVTVEVTSEGHDLIGTLVNGFTYVGTPTVTSVSPAGGPLAGGNTVTIDGSNLTGASEVDFGGTPGTDIDVVSDTELTVKPPAGSGTVDVKVFSAGGNVTKTGAYNYVPAPSGLSVLPGQGPATGGTAVTITGTDLSDATSVTFGGTAGTITENTSSSITVTTPAHSAGAVDVAVATAGGGTTDTGGFTYIAAAALTSVDPNTGPPVGGTLVTIHGTNLADVTEVDFGTAAGISLSHVSDTELTVSSPSGTGSVDVTALSPGGNDTLPDAYSYDLPRGTVTIREVSEGGDGSFAFTSPEPTLNTTITTSSGSGESGPISLAPGNYVVTAATGGPFGLMSVRCDDNDSVGDVAGHAASISLAADESVTCTFTSYNSQGATKQLIHNFFNAQGDLLLANLPDEQRRIDRLQGIATAPGNPASALMGYLPQAASGALANPAISASLAEIDAITNKPKSPFDAWFQATLGAYDTNGLSGQFGIVSLGADYLVNKDLLVGGFVQADTEPDATDDAGGSISGRGWIAGPYATIRLSDNLFLDVLAGAGQSDNSVNPDGFYSDNFVANRWIASASLTGQWQSGNWTFTPTARLSWYQSTSEAYVDSLGVDIPSVTGGVAQTSLGPRISYRFDLGDGVEVATSVGLNGILDVNLDGAAASISDARGRVDAGFDLTMPGGATLGLSGSFDGLGSSSVRTIAGNARLSVPIN